MQRSRSTSNLFPLDPEIERTLHRERKELEARYKTERELDILVQPQPTVMVGNGGRPVIEAARPNLANMTQAIVKPDITGHFELKQYMVQLIQSTGQYVGLSHEDPQRHIQNFLEVTDTYNYPNVSKDYVRLTLFPFLLLGEAKDWLQKEPANSIHTWDDLAKKFLIKFFPTKKTKSLRSQILGSQQRDGEEEPRRAMKQKAAGVLELDDFSAMRADIAKLANQMNRMTMNQTQQLKHVQQMSICCEMCGDNHTSDMCPRNPDLFIIWDNKAENQYKPQGNFNQPQGPPQQIEESTHDLLKKLLHDNQQLRTDFRNLERQMGQLAANQNTRPADAIRDIPKYAKYIKDIVANNRRLTEFEIVALTEECTSRVQNKLPQKLKDPGNFTTPVRIGNVDVGHALCDLGASINLMPLSLYKKLGLGAPKPTTVILQLADRSIAYLEGVIEDVLLKIGKFIFPADFIILDFEPDEKVPIILGKPLLATCDTIINVREGKMIMRVDNEEAVFNVYKAIQLPRHYDICHGDG
ncbi:uncharacterized protein [Nicotiana sylvestris]|uniref:uncharacterized protein n=1 Tax=Nicotiana sylvestris TaxID=4096 RepID=UPI00388C9929